jgi:hypothetical protein
MLYLFHLAKTEDTTAFKKILTDKVKPYFDRHTNIITEYWFKDLNEMAKLNRTNSKYIFDESISRIIMINDNKRNNGIQVDKVDGEFRIDEK